MAIRRELIALNGRAHHDTLEVLRQQQVAAATYYYIGLTRRPENTSHLDGLAFVFELQEPLALDLDAKRVVRLQTIILEILHFIYLSLLTSHL